MTQTSFHFIKTEGGLLPSDLLSRIQSGDPDLKGTLPESYHLAPGERLGEAVNKAWSELRAHWLVFQSALEKESETKPATGLTRDRWLLPLFQALGYGRLQASKTTTLDGRNFAISHFYYHSPIHLLGCRVDLEKRQKGVAGAAQSSPHSLVQEFLNRSDDHLWGFLSNGYTLRVLRDHHSMTRQAYVEFDLQAIMDGEQYSEFFLLWMICHQSRVEGEKPENCLLESWMTASREEGIRALDKLRDGVESAIKELGTGFLKHPANRDLRQALECGTLDKQDYYRQLLRLVYRLIFIFVAEDRNALLDPNCSDDIRKRFESYYSTRRIRNLADRRRGGPHGDLWQGLALVMHHLYDGEPSLGLPALGSWLWNPDACSWLIKAKCSNKYLLGAFHRLTHIRDGQASYPVNWRNIGADELGSIYEGLLELHPVMNQVAGTFELKTASGNERKTSGSYYTPSSLVDCLLNSALEPILDQACKTPTPEQAIFDLKICDPACGSGHFLVAAARRTAKRLATIRSGDVEPSPNEVQHALRDVVGHCIFGVDLNPMAVELCKVSLWMEALEPGKPLSFLDSHIKCGNALLGATPALMSRGIPNEALNPITGDDKVVARRLKKRNKAERGGQETLMRFFEEASTETRFNKVTAQAKALEEKEDEDIVSVRDKQKGWEAIAQSREFREAWFLADAWCGAFVWPKQEGGLEGAAITHDVWKNLERNPKAADAVTVQTIQSLAMDYLFFHWHLAFPQVFAHKRNEFDEDDHRGWTGGFDVVLGNPPWERVKLDETEWFASTKPVIAKARSVERKKLIDKLMTCDLILYNNFIKAKRNITGICNFLRNSNSHPLTTQGEFNTYSVFAELNRNLLNPLGLMGCVVQSGIATDKVNSKFFQDIVKKKVLHSVFSFDNKDLLFPSIKTSTRFCLISIGGSQRNQIKAIKFVFYARNLDEAFANDRQFSLPAEEIQLINPNTQTCPVFFSPTDARIVSSIYKRIPILFDSKSDTSSWHLTIRRICDMNKIGILSNCVPLAKAIPKGDFLPMYEAKLAGRTTHRKKTYEGPSARPLFEEERCNPSISVTPRYWVPISLISNKLGGLWQRKWLLTWQDITDVNTMSRTVNAAILPFVGTDFTLRVGFPLLDPANSAIALLATFNSFVFDYVCRQKLGGIHLSDYILNQLPVLKRSSFKSRPPWSNGSSFQDWLNPRIIEQTYTAWDLELFAKDCGVLGPPFQWNESRRFLISSEIDAAFFHFYGINRPDLDHIMETFLIIKRKDKAKYGDFRTKLQIMQIYDRMQEAMDSGQPYQTILDPPPADPSQAHTESTRPDWA